MLIKYLVFFKKESNKYVINELQRYCERTCETIKRLGHLIDVHSDIISEMEHELGLKYKLVPGGDFNRFYEELTNDNTRVRAETRLSEKANRLAQECRVTYKEYRATVR